MPHVKEHPLAGRRVVTNSALVLGDLVTVVDWMDRVPSLGLEARHRLIGWYQPDAHSVVVRDRIGFALVPCEDLPSYDPQPVGSVS